VKKLIAIILTILTTYTLGATMMIQPAKPRKFPIFKLNMSVYSCGYDFRINDVAIQYNHYYGGNDVEFPINEFMASGKNTISMYLYPANNAKKLKADDQQCEANLSLNLTYPAFDISHTLASMNYSSPADNLVAQLNNTNKHPEAYTLNSHNDYKVDGQDGDIKVSNIEIKPFKTDRGPGIVLTRTIYIPNDGLPKWAWEDSDKIKNDAATEASLRKEFNMIMHSIQTKNFDNLKGIFDERDKEMNEAYPSDIPSSGTLPELIKDANNPKVELLPLGPHDGDLYIYAHGKLATIQGWDTTPAVVFNHKDQSGSENYPIIFRRQDGKWIISR
jgi:hypothetical protein